MGNPGRRSLGDRFGHIKSVSEIPPPERPAVRNDLNHVLEQLKAVPEAKGISDGDKKQAKTIHDDLMKSVEYVPWWVRILSALCLGIGTMVGYKRIVRTLGERLGNKHLAPAQGASAELVAAGLIGFAGFSRLSCQHHARCHRWHCRNHGCVGRRSPERDHLANCGRVAFELFLQPSRFPPAFSIYCREQAIACETAVLVEL